MIQYFSRDLSSALSRPISGEVEASSAVCLVTLQHIKPAYGASGGWFLFSRRR